MKKSMLTKLGRAISAALVFSLLAPTSVSSNQELVAKNFTVIGWDDLPVANASVAVFWYVDAATGTVSSAIKVTDEFGKVSIDIPKNAGNNVDGTTTSLSYGVVPPVGDLKGNAATGGTFTPTDSATDQNVEVKLKKADLTVELIDTDGTSVKPFSEDSEPIFYVFEQTTSLTIAGPGRVLRSGPMGISLPNLDPNKTYEFIVARTQPIKKSNRFSWRYALKVQMNGETPNFTFFTDRSATVPLLPSASGVNKLEYKKGIINFLSSDGSPFVAGTSVSAALCPVANSISCLNFAVDTKGNAFFNQLAKLPSDGEYILKVGLIDYPTTVSNGLLTINGLTPNQDGTYSIRLTEPNLKVEVVTPSPNPSKVDTSVQITSGVDGKDFVAFARTGSTFASFALSDRDDYWLTVVPPNDLLGQYVETKVPFKVQGGVPIFDGIQAVNGVFPIPLNATNFKFKLTGPDGQSLRSTGYVDYCKTDSTFDRSIRDCSFNRALVNTQTAIGGILLGDGFYLMDMRPGISFDGQEASRTLKVSVQGSNISIDGVQKDSEGIFTLSSEAPNAAFVFKDANGPITIGQNDWGISYRLQKKSGSYQPYVDYFSRSNQFAFKIMDSGTYRVEAEFYGNNGLNKILAYSPEFTYDGSKFTVAGKPDSATLTGENKLDIVKGVENFQVQLVSPEDPGIQLTTQNIASISKQCLGGGDCYTNEGLPGIRFDATGKGGVTLPLDIDTTFYLEITHENFANKVYQIKVAQGQISVEYNGVPLVKGEAGRYIVSPSVANVTGKVVDKDGVPLVLGNNKWVRAQIQKWNELQQNWQNLPFSGTNVNQQGEFKLSINDLGRYRVWIEPFGFDLYGQTPSQEFEYKSDGFYVGDKSKLASLTGENRIFVQLPPTNFKFKLVNPASPTSGISGWIGILKENSDGNLTWLQGVGVNNTGLGGANLADGKYRLEVNVNGFARKFYDLVITNSGQDLILKDGNTVVSLESGRFPLKPATVNLTGVIKDSNGGAISITPGTWISINLQQWDEIGNFWQWTPIWSGVNNSGAFVFNVETPGKYRLMAIPNGIDGLSTNFSDQFEFTNDMKFKVGDQLSSSLSIEIRLAAPNFLVLVTDPSRSDEPISSAWLSIFKELDQGSTWVTNIDINNASQGKGGAKLEDGRYRVEVNTGVSGLSRSLYYVTINGQNFEVKRGEELILPGTDGRFKLSPSVPNIKGKVLGPNGLPLVPGNNRWVSINLQRFSPNGYWEWSNNWSNTVQDGTFAFNVAEEGKYRLRIEPNGYLGVSVTYSAEFNVKKVNGALSFEYQSNGGTVESSSLNLGDITLGTPSLLVKVAASEQNATPLNFIGVEIRRNGAWIDWAGTGPSGLSSISFNEEGAYELIVYPGPTQIAQGLARKSYKVTVTKNQGSLKGVIDGLTAQGDGTYLLYLGAANLKGIVLTPDVNGNPGSPIKDIQVVARDVLTGRDLWENQAQTGVDGKWAMSLPDGTYKIRAVIWGSTLYTESDPFGDVKVAGGTATVSAADPLNLTLKLSEPRWKGQVLSPDNVPVPFANVSAYVGGVWYGTNANNEGRFALSIPNFTDFDMGDFIEIRDDRTGSFPMRRLQKQRETDPDLSTFFTGQGCETADAWKTCKQVVFKFQGSNTKIKVMAGTQAASNIWVNIDADNVGWIGGGRTNSDGIASFNIDKNSLTGLNLRIRADVNGNPQWSASYTSTMATVLQGEIVAALVDSNSIYEKTVNLGSPNFRAQLREPNNGPIASWAWVELFSKDTGEWIQGSGTDASGLFTMRIPMPSSDGSKEFFLIVNPSWNSSANVSRNQYKVIATKAGPQESVSVFKNDTPVSTTSLNSANYFELQLAEPSVRGVVKRDGTTAVRDSWVTPIDDLTGEYLWQYGANSKQDGSFALALPKDGKYRLEANVPWGVSGLARSSQCLISVVDGKVISQDSTCNLVSNVVQLTLRSPNLTMTLKKPGGANVSFAWVGVCIERWCSGGQSGLDGKVSIFIDVEAVNQTNGWSSQTRVSRPINVFVDPPWGSSDIVRWSCQSGEDKPVCKNLADFISDIAFPTTAIGDVEFAAPNLSLYVKKPLPDESLLPFAWVNLFTANGVWLGGSNTDVNGKASFNVADSYFDKSNPNNDQFKFRVEINPPWNASTSYSRIVYGEGSGLLFSDIQNKSFRIGAPNVVVRVKTTVSTIWNKWGWISLEKDLGTDNWSGLGGFGLDSSGKTALKLESNTKYRLIAYPGPGASGTRRICIFSTSNDNSEVKISTLSSCPSGSLATDSDPSTLDFLDISLSSGNVTGKLMFGNVPVTDALIYAVPLKTGLMGELSGNSLTVQNSDGLVVGMYLAKENGVGVFGGTARIVAIEGNTVTISSDTPSTGGQITFSAIDESRVVKAVSSLNGEFSLLLDPSPISKWRISVFPVKTVDNKTISSKVIFEDQVPGIDSLIDLQTILLNE